MFHGEGNENSLWIKESFKVGIKNQGYGEEVKPGHDYREKGEGSKDWRGFLSLSWSVFISPYPSPHQPSPSTSPS